MNKNIQLNQFISQYTYTGINQANTDKYLQMNLFTQCGDVKIDIHIPEIVIGNSKIKDQYHTFKDVHDYMDLY